MEYRRSVERTKRFKSVFLTFCALSIPGVLLPAQTADQFRQRDNDRIESLERGIVPIRTTTADGVSDQGTGFVVSFTPVSIKIVTALHVVRDARSIEVAFYDNPDKYVPARKLPGDDPDLDVAMIEVKASQGFQLPSNLPQYNFAASDTMQASSQVTSVDGDWIRVLNLITRLSHEGDPGKFEYTNTSVGKGFSGGPIFDAYGDIVGMHDAMRSDGKFAIGVKVEAALQALQKLGYTVPKAGPIVNPWALATAPQSRSTIPCQNGCETTLSALKHLQHYSVYDTRGGFGAPICYKEDVYQVPVDWPGAGLFFHVSTNEGCPLSKTTSVSIRWAQTDRKGDVDTTMSAVVLSGSSGQGYLKDSQGTMWTVTARNPNFGDRLDVSAISITIKPFSPF